MSNLSKILGEMKAGTQDHSWLHRRVQGQLGYPVSKDEEVPVVLAQPIIPALRGEGG